MNIKWISLRFFCILSVSVSRHSFTMSLVIADKVTSLLPCRRPLDPWSPLIGKSAACRSIRLDLMRMSRIKALANWWWWLPVDYSRESAKSNARSTDVCADGTDFSMAIQDGWCQGAFEWMKDGSTSCNYVALSCVLPPSKVLLLLNFCCPVNWIRSAKKHSMWRRMPRRRLDT